MSSYKKEWLLLKKCEKDAYTGIVAKERFIKLLEIFQNLRRPKEILDVGGNLGTARWFREKFPKARVAILNRSKKELSSYPDAIYQDAQNFRVKKKYDLIFAGEIIEHVYNPDGLLASCLLALKPRGYFIISTPNLACLYNRIFLLFGWTPGFYSPSMRYHIGNPFLANKKIDKFGYIGDHKSVFTWKGLAELLRKYRFRIIDFYGYDYGQEEKFRVLGGLECKIPNSRLRMILNKFLPTKLKEGMMFICQAPSQINTDQVSRGILKQNLWEL